MKIYDRDIHKAEQNIEEMTIVILAFFLGFIVGFFAMFVEIEAQEEYIKMLEQDRIEKQVYTNMLEEVEG